MRDAASCHDEYICVSVPFAREGDETVQVTGSRAAFSLGLRHHKLTLPRGQTSVQRWRLSRRQAVEIRRLGAGDWRRPSSLTIGRLEPMTECASRLIGVRILPLHEVKLTVPASILSNICPRTSPLSVIKVLSSFE